MINIQTIETKFFGICELWEVPSNEINTFNEKTILDTTKPKYIPEADLKFLRYHHYRFPFVKLAGNEYYILLTEKNGIICKLDLLVAIQDYYFKFAKAQKKVELEIKIEEIKKEYENKMEDWALQSYIKLAKKRIKMPRMINGNRMSITNMTLYNKIGIHNTNEIWKLHNEMMKDYEQKSIDMEASFEENYSIHSKGEKTSYGDKNLNNSLLDEYGVMIKRQNGHDLTGDDITYIQTALNEVFQIFGNCKNIAKSYNLKISYSEEKCMHARRAIGIFHRRYNAIGISIGKNVLIHEWAHFVDHILGTKYQFNYSSDDMNSLSFKIAKTFRSNLKTKKAGYWSRTVECFARAFEQYYLMVWHNENADQFQAGYNADGNFVSNEIFINQIKPLIEEWIANFKAIN